MSATNVSVRVWRLLLGVSAALVALAIGATPALANLALTQISSDPFTNSTSSWRTILSKRDPNNRTAARRIFDVKSGSRATAIDGTTYSAW